LEANVIDLKLKFSYSHTDLRKKNWISNCPLEYYRIPISMNMHAQTMVFICTEIFITYFNNWKYNYFTKNKFLCFIESDLAKSSVHNSFPDHKTSDKLAYMCHIISVCTFLISVVDIIVFRNLEIDGRLNLNMDLKEKSSKMREVDPTGSHRRSETKTC
jgi:hypothetical protein